MYRTIGTCGNCGGPVQTPTVWHGVVPPTPTCAHCGATALANYGPTIPMEPPTPTCAHCGATALANYGPTIPMEPPRIPRAPSGTSVDPEVLRFWRGDGYRS